ncbi:MAG: glycosyltransferase family 4 protein [Actinobacteria bacterium]|nr:glycosyltransferase family 4 protein [Actinomycetota bacterium]
MKKKKAILIISALDYWSLGDGKGGPALYKTLTVYSENGWNVYFVTGNKRDDINDDIAKNIHVIRFMTPSFLSYLMKIKEISFIVRLIWWLHFQMRAFIEAYKISRIAKIDVIYGYEVDAMPVAKVISLILGVPLVARFQGTSYGVFWEGKRLKFIRAWEHAVGLRIPADLIIMTNDGTQGDRVLQGLGINTSKVCFWMNGVDWDLFDRAPQYQRAKVALGLDNYHVVLCISRLVSWKRVDRAVKCIKGVVEKCPDALLVIVGDGPELERLENLALKLGVSEYVRFVGAVPHTEIPTYLAAADIFLSLYDFSNLGNPLLEAMIAGRCIVTINNGDTGNIIVNGVNGILLEEEELDRLPSIIIDLLQNETFRDRLGKGAYEFAKANFWSWDERIGAEIESINRLIMKQSSGSFLNKICCKPEGEG